MTSRHYSDAEIHTAMVNAMTKMVEENADNETLFPEARRLELERLRTMQPPYEESEVKMMIIHLRAFLEALGGVDNRDPSWLAKKREAKRARKAARS